MTRTQNPNHPVTGLQFAPMVGSNVAYPSTWYDLTPRMVSYSMKRGKQRELGLAEAGTASFVLRDKDEYLNPMNTSSPFNSGGNSLKIYRPLRLWQMPAVSGSWAGNLLNATNDTWLTVRGSTGGYADSAGFEGGTVGGWAPVTSGATVANSAVRAHDGTKSMLVTWPTQTGGGFASTANVWLEGVPLRVGDVYTISAWIWITSGTSVVLRCNGQTATSTSTTGAWQRVSLTFTVADAADNDIYIYASGSTTSGQNINVDSVQLEYAGSASAFTTSGPTIHPQYTGFIERYPKTWRYMGFYGYCQIICVDALGMIPRVQLNAALYQEIVLDHPTYWWSFDDGIGVAGVFNQKGSNQDPQIQGWLGDSASGAGGASSAPASTSRGGPGADAPGYIDFLPAWTSPSAPPSAPNYGACWTNGIWTTSNLIGGTAAGFTVEIWFLPRAIGWTQRILTLATSWTPHNDTHELGLDGSGNLTYKYYNSSGTLVESFTSASAVSVGGWNHLVFTTASSGGTITSKAYINGTNVGTATRSSATVPQRKLILIGSGPDGVSSGSVLSGDPDFAPFYGRISNLVIYNATTLSTTRIGVHATCSSTGYEGDYTGQRIKRILAYAGWGGYTNIADATGVQQGQIRGLQDAFTADAIKIASDTDQGLLYAAPSGMLQYLPQATIAASTPSLTFGEDTAGGETPYREGVVEELEPSQIYNYVTVSPNALPGNDVYLMPVYAQDATSIQDYGTRTLSLTIQPRDGSTGLTQLQNMAAFLLLQKKNPRPMVTGVKIQLGARPTLWAIALALTLGQCVSWKRRTSAGVTITVTGYIQTINWTENPAQGAECTIDIEPIQV